MNPNSKLHNHLLDYFNLTQFRTGQKEIIEDIMRGKDVLGVLPTGSGKSLCYQLPARLLPNVTIVVSPLISLMTDQVQQLKSMNFKEVIALNSFMPFEERQHVLRHLSAYKLIFLSPELLQQPVIKSKLQQLEISLFVVDEAHCISQWGHEFRPNYLKLNETVKLLGHPPVLALSATAPADVQTDIIKSLRTPNMIKHIYPIDRRNIALSIEKVKGDAEKIARLLKILQTYHVPTLIYFSSRKMTERVTNSLTKQLKTKHVAFYHGGMEPMDRISIQQQFMNDQLDIICCTSAFGMGINKDNIRLVIHYHFPPQLEAFIQEIGRAGRDGENSISIVLYSENDAYLPKNMIELELPSEEQLKKAFQYIASPSVNHIPLKELETELTQNLSLSETQWRFINYQIEKSDIINNEKVINNQKNVMRIFHDINTHRQNRLQLKYSMLSDMMNWLNQSECLRQHLYKHFQESYGRIQSFCCSNCGLRMDEWKPEQTVKRHLEDGNWHVKLKRLLCIGDGNGTK